MSLWNYFSESIQVLEAARQSWSEVLLAGAIETITRALRSGKPLLVCGNGGSAASCWNARP
jgi:D-sedoheptulose 7-phosphate isomerase